MRADAALTKLLTELSYQMQHSQPCADCGLGPDGFPRTTAIPADLEEAQDFVRRIHWLMQNLEQHCASVITDERMLAEMMRRRNGEGWDDPHRRAKDIADELNAAPDLAVLVLELLRVASAWAPVEEDRRSGTTCTVERIDLATRKHVVAVDEKRTHQLWDDGRATRPGGRAEADANATERGYALATLRKCPDCGGSGAHAFSDGGDRCWGCRGTGWTYQ